MSLRRPKGPDGSPRSGAEQSGVWKKLRTITLAIAGILAAADKPAEAETPAPFPKTVSSSTIIYYGPKGSSPSEDVSPVNKTLLRMAQKVRTGHVTLHLYEDADEAAIECSQLHWAKNLNEKSAASVGRCQDEIHDLIVFTIDENIDFAFFNESYLTSMTQGDYLKGIEKFAGEPISGPTARTTWSAGDVLWRDGKIRMFPVENPFTHYFAAPREDGTMPDQEPRETDIVTNIARHPSKIGMVQIGASHDLGNNVRRLNEGRRQKPLSYMQWRPREVIERKIEYFDFDDRPEPQSPYFIQLVTQVQPESAPEVASVK